MPQHITVSEYDPKWPFMYSEEKEKITAILKSNCIAIYHIGSTSVEGLWAKPVIDILVAVRSLEETDAASESFSEIGYEYLGEFGLPGRRYLRKGGDERTHQIHIFRADDWNNISRHLAFRDFMRSHEEERSEYAELKKSLAEKFPYDIDGYCDGKDGFVKEMEKRALSLYDCSWDRLYIEAGKVQYERHISSLLEAGAVSAALLTEKGNIYSSQFVVVNSQQVIDKIKNNIESHGETFVDDRWNYICDADVTKEQGESIIKNMGNGFSEEESYKINCDFRNVGEDLIVGMYAGLMFVGIFLSILFLMTMILIMYYKQISEGYDDKDKYRIMKNVGLDKREIKRSIRSQVLTVFFMPLVVACAHVAAAFSLIGRMLEVFGMMNIWLYVQVTLIAIAIFAIFYAVVYTLTSKLYYKIVN